MANLQLQDQLNNPAGNTELTTSSSNGEGRIMIFSHDSFDNNSSRFCCSVAVFFCFGTTHFCNPCHDDHSRCTGTPKDKMPHCPVSTFVDVYLSIDDVHAGWTRFETVGRERVPTSRDASADWRGICSWLRLVPKRTDILRTPTLYKMNEKEIEHCCYCCW